MKQLVVALALLAIFGCAGRGDRDLQQAFEAARLALWRGDLPEAYKLSERGVSLSESRSKSEPLSDWPWRFRNLAAETLIDLDPAKALPLLDTPIPEDARLDAVRARQRYLIAKRLVARGALQDARVSLDRARQLLPPEDRETRPDIDALSGQIQFRLGRWPDGEAAMQGVLSEATGRGEHYRQAAALNDLGMARLKQNRCDEAVSWFERVRALPEIAGSSIYAKALNNTGQCLMRLGQFDEAVAVQREAIRIHEHGSRAAFEQALGALGSTYLDQADVAGALPYLNRALTIALEADQKEDAALWARNLAAAHIYEGRWEEGERLNEEAERLTPSTRSGRVAYSALNRARIAAGRGRHDESRRMFLEILAGPQIEPGVKWKAHDGLAGLALAAGQRQQAASHFEAALDTIEKTRSDLLKADYRLSFLTQLIRFYRSYVDVLVAQGATERALEIADSSRGRVLAERHGVATPARVNVAGLRRLASQRHITFLSYWLTPARSYLWMIGPGSLQLHELPAAEEIDALVRQHQQTIGSSLVDPLAAQVTAGDRLYALLLAPVARSIPAGGNVVIVPDGVLYGLNFETLPVPGPKRHYWIEDAVVQIAPSLAMLGQAASAPAGARPSLLLFGNAVAHEPEYPSLHYASAEMTSITRNLGSDRVVTFQAEQASPSAYRHAELGRFGLVHFTAHAATNVESPLDSAIILSGTETYKLYARDIAALPLSAELVTVSACRSAGERTYSGEGLVGFAWAFLRAGAQRVIAGLWDVDDRSTAELMDVLYARLAAGDAPPRALREAKLSLLRRGDNFAKPYYWAPFQVFTVSP